MKYVQINAFSNSWADQIIFRKHRELQASGDESWVFWGKGQPSISAYERRIQSRLGYYIDAFQTKVLDGKIGFHSKVTTKKLLTELDIIEPDVVHLHSLIGYYINIEMLFAWLLDNDCKVLWTLHDCWAFTGHCLHFTYVGCSQWKEHCGLNRPCPQPDAYIRTLRRGMEAWNYEHKRRIFTSLPQDRLTIITPSKWLAGLVRQSYLSKYEVEVRHNQVDTEVFKPTESDFRRYFDVEKRRIVLGVASRWSERKGLLDFARLAVELDSSQFAIVMVGLSPRDVRQVKRVITSQLGVGRLRDVPGKSLMVQKGIRADESSRSGLILSDIEAEMVDLPGGARLILCGRANSAEQLAAVYTMADVLFNPTREDNYPTVNLEAQACGTPVYTYATGGCAETLTLANSRVCISLPDFVNSMRFYEIQ